MMKAPTNYVEGTNPFGLVRPPLWWLDYMRAFDPDLVMIPSVKRPVYNLARTHKFSPGIGPMSLTDVGGDLSVMHKLGLVPAAVIIPATSGIWTTSVFDVDLYNRDIWRHGGPDEFTRKLEDGEKEKAVKDDKQLNDDCLVRRRDMARSFKARTGQRTKIPSLKPKKSSTVLSSPQSAPTPSTGSRIILA